MSLSDPELLQKAGTCDGRGGHDNYVHYREQGIPRLPPKLLRRQNTWHDVSVLTRDVDVIEQITTSVWFEENSITYQNFWMDPVNLSLLPSYVWPLTPAQNGIYFWFFFFEI